MSTIDRDNCDKGIHRWDCFCARKYPGLVFMTPRTHTLESMANCLNSEFVKLANKEVKDNGYKVK